MKFNPANISWSPLMPKAQFQILWVMQRWTRMVPTLNTVEEAGTPIATTSYRRSPRWQCWYIRSATRARRSRDRVCSERSRDDAWMGRLGRTAEVRDAGKVVNSLGGSEGIDTRWCLDCVVDWGWGVQPGHSFHTFCSVLGPHRNAEYSTSSNTLIAPPPNSSFLCSLYFWHSHPPSRLSTELRVKDLNLLIF